MAHCGGCGAPIQWGVRVDTGERVPLEPRAELGPGPRRYLIELERAATGHLLRPVSPTSPVEAYADHRLECPDHGDGHS